MPEKISLKDFWERLEAKLAQSSRDELRGMLRAMAHEIQSEERPEFLQKLDLDGLSPTFLRDTLSQPELIRDIEDLALEIQHQMDHAAAWEDEHNMDPYYDEHELGPYERFIPEIENLFEHTQAVFEFGDFSLARKAYETLLAKMFIEDDEFGRGIRVRHLSINTQEVRGRYLRAVYETTPIENRPPTIYAALSESQDMAGIFTPPMFEELITASPLPLSERETFFENWIKFLETDESAAAQSWLREAVRLHRDAAGLEELARARGIEQPRVYLDWFAALLAKGRYEETLKAAQEALEILPSHLPVRAAIADDMSEAAQHLQRDDRIMEGRWEALRAQPGLKRVLAILERTALEAHVKTAKKIVRILDRYQAQSPDAAEIPRSYEPDWLERPAVLSPIETTHALLLAHEFARAQKHAARCKVLGWSRSDNVQGLVLPCFLLLLAGRPMDDLPPNVSRLWEAALGKDDFPYYLKKDPDPLFQQLADAYKVSFRQVELPFDMQTEYLDWVLHTARERAMKIVGNQYRGSYYKAAGVIVAGSEVLEARGQPDEGRAFVREIREKFPRHRAFQTELKNALRTRK